VDRGTGEYNNPYIIDDGREEITFTIDGTTYTALEGMTYRHWLMFYAPDSFKSMNSEYENYENNSILNSPTDFQISYITSGEYVRIDNYIVDGDALTIYGDEI